METLCPRSGKTNTGCLFSERASETMWTTLQTRDPYPHVYAGPHTAELVQFGGTVRQSLCSKPTGEPQTKPDIRLSALIAALFGILTNVCLPSPSSLPSSPPSASRSSSCFLRSRCSWHLLELPVDPWPPDELYAQKLKYKAISEELDHALNDMTSL